MRSLLRPIAAAAFLASAAALPRDVAAQSSGKWTGTIPTLGTVRGSADLEISSRNEKQSRVKISFRNTAREQRVAWDIVAGRCRDEGAPIAPLAAFQQVMTTMDGGGTVSVNLPKLEPGKLYYFRVYDPQTAPTDATAYGCANISEQP
jgi:hypothetical protein